MSTTDTKKTRGPRKRAEPLFITKSEIANHLGVGGMATIDKWVKAGEFPPYHSKLGERYFVWLRSHWNHYVATGSWPSSAFPNRGA